MDISVVGLVLVVVAFIVGFLLGYKIAKSG